jgi:pyruvate carboxylase
MGDETKMADEVEVDIEASLNLVVNTTDRSGNMKTELKQIIYETVSSLRNLFVTLKSKNEIQASKFKELEAQASKSTAGTPGQQFTVKKQREGLA